MTRAISASRVGVLLAALGFTALIAGCSDYKADEDPSNPTRRLETTSDHSYMGSILGEGGLNVFGDNQNQGEGGGGIGVNSFLWRATLDTISFMPVSTADAFGGVVLTDWHSPAEATGERFKLNIYILGRTLRADGVRVSVFRQVKEPNGTWRDVNVTDGTGAKIENAILTRARMLRHETLQK